MVAGAGPVAFAMLLGAASALGLGDLVLIGAIVWAVGWMAVFPALALASALAGRRVQERFGDVSLDATGVTADHYPTAVHVPVERILGALVITNIDYEEL